MRSLKNRNLSENFTLYEFIEARLPIEGVTLNWKNINEFRQQEYMKLAQVLQDVRYTVNSAFRAENKNKDIGLLITSGFRCKAWELIRGRNGTSQHTVAAAADIQPLGCSDELSAKIMKFLYDMEWHRERGHQGGFAVKWPTYQGGKMITRGFVHYDTRKAVARWTY